MADKNGIERTYANKDEYDFEGGEVYHGPDFDTYTVMVKWTGTIASFNIMADHQSLIFFVLVRHTVPYYAACAGRRSTPASPIRPATW